MELTTRKRFPHVLSLHDREKSDRMGSCFATLLGVVKHKVLVEYLRSNDYILRKVFF